MDEYWGLELYRSWCCPSVCKVYPDMQLRGDQLGDRSSHSPHWVAAPPEDWQPVLHSQDLVDMEEEAPGDSLPWLGGNQPPQHPHPHHHHHHHHDDGYMEMDTSLPGLDSMRELDSMRGLDRLSNSMLNGYLETKLLEVYRQHLQDSLARGADASVSPGMVVVPTVVVDSPVAAAGVPSRGQWGTEGDRPTTSDSIHYLSTCGLRSNSHFSSPELRISDVQSDHVKDEQNQQ